MTAVAAVVVALIGAGAWWRARSRSTAARHQARALDALPPSLELCQVVLGSGGTLADCLRVLARHGPEPVRSAAAEGVAAAGRGAQLDVALELARDRLGLGFQPLIGTLLLGCRQGGSVGALLTRLSAEAAASRRRQADLRARRLPVLLLLPLVGFALPAVLIGTVAPLVLVGLRHLDF